MGYGYGLQVWTTGMDYGMDYGYGLRIWAMDSEEHGRVGV
jgi:hypothetical protein